MKPLLVAFALVLAACAAEAPDIAEVVPPLTGGRPPTGSVDEALEPRWDGLGPARFGMEADAVRAAWPGELGGNPAEGETCFHLGPSVQPEPGHFAMMFGDGRFVRYSVRNDAMVAPGGGRRGMSDAEIDALHPGRVERRPHKYTDGQYLRIAGDGDRVLVFETDGGGTVTEWRVGVPPYVDYVEGCS